MPFYRWSVAMLCVLPLGVFAACSSDGSAPPSGSTGPGDWGPGDYPPELGAQEYLELEDLPGQGGYARGFKVHVPPGYDPEVPTPLVFCLHGLGQNAVMFCVDGAGMVEKSDEVGFLLVMPNGYGNSWNGGTCCGTAVTEGLDDVAFVRAVFEEVGVHVNVDLDRVFATGLSNGAYMSYRLACEASDIFAAVAPGSGAIGTDDIGGGTAVSGDFASCAPASKVSVLDMHGTSDFLVSYDLQEPSLSRIATQNGCGGGTSLAAIPASGGDTSCESYGCPDGIDVTGCTVSEGGHVWFGSDNCGTGASGGCDIVGNNSDMLSSTDAMWDFFATHPRPGSQED